MYIKLTVLVFFNILSFYTFTNAQDIDPCDTHFDIISDLSQEDCGANFVFQKVRKDLHECFPQCVPYVLTDPCSEKNPCPPGFRCPQNGKPCETDKFSCINNPKNPWLDAWKPTCLPDGSWAPKQCKGEPTSGRCFCYDTVGNRIFGQAFNDKAGNMTCACSRRKTELRNQGSRIYTTLHCDSMGNYEPLQCDDGHCWCAESKTGDVISKIVPSYLMTYLPCYSKEKIGLNYSRQCESDEFAQKNLLYEFNLHGTDHINFPHVMCDDDGNYGAYQIDASQVYCRWWDNTNLGFGSEISTIKEVNCYCARDKKMYEETGSSLLLICLPNGNYKREQYHTINGKWYCVDADGFKCSDFWDKIPDCNGCYLKPTKM